MSFTLPPNIHQSEREMLESIAAIRGKRYAARAEEAAVALSIFEIVISYADSIPPALRDHLSKEHRENVLLSATLATRVDTGKEAFTEADSDFITFVARLMEQRLTTFATVLRGLKP